jgi:hypothetical protein
MLHWSSKVTFILRQKCYKYNYFKTDEVYIRDKTRILKDLRDIGGA